MTRDEAWSVVSDCCEQMSRDEMRVVARICTRIVTGRSVYGPLCLATDKRNWAEERRQELYDAVVYDACDELRRDTEPAPPYSVTDDGRSVVVVGDADIIPDAAPTLPSTAPEGLYREVG